MIKMVKHEPKLEMETTWDARQGYCQELMFRINIFLSGDWKLPQAWFEALQDFFNLSSCMMAVEKVDLYLGEIKKIEELLYSEGTKHETVGKRKEAYDKIWKVYRAVMRDLWNAGIFLPQHEKTDPGEAILHGFR